MKKHITFLLMLCILLTACSKGSDSGGLSSSSSSWPDDSILSSSSAVPGSSQSGPSTTGSRTPGSSSSNATSGGTDTSNPGSGSSAGSSGRATVNVTIPEGYSVSQIGDKLEASGVCSKAAFLATINSYDFSPYHPIVNQIPANDHRCYKLEGYLYPDTYTFYVSMNPQDAIGKMLRGGENKNISQYTYPGMTSDQVIILASIIEKEVANKAQYKNVSSVFHNRLKAGMKLQSDATIYYMERYVEPNLTGDVERYNAYYNTYKCAALPAGAICSPGLAAIQAAAAPATTDYLYFFTDSAGNYYYAATYDEHKAQMAAAGVTEETQQVGN